MNYNQFISTCTYGYVPPALTIQGEIFLPAWVGCAWLLIQCKIAEIL